MRVSTLYGSKGLKHVEQLSGRRIGGKSCYIENIKYLGVLRVFSNRRVKKSFLFVSRRWFFVLRSSKTVFSFVSKITESSLAT